MRQKCMTKPKANPPRARGGAHPSQPLREMWGPQNPVTPTNRNGLAVHCPSCLSSTCRSATPDPRDHAGTGVRTASLSLVAVENAIPALPPDVAGQYVQI